MKITSFNSAPQEYEIDLDHYNGKDVLHEGFMMPIDPIYSWERISATARKKIRKAKSNRDITIKRVEGSKKDILDFRTIWFDPNDDTIPEILDPEEIMYMAYLKDELIGGLILTPTGTNLYTHNLGSSLIGKNQNITYLLLWHALEDLKDSQYKFIDVGVSYRPNLYAFFKNWKVITYPVIFKPPFIRPDIRLVPFKNEVGRYRIEDDIQDIKFMHDFFGEKFTVLPRGINAIQVLMKYLKLDKDQNVAIFKTFNDNDYISRCVTETISNYGKVSRTVNDKTKAIMVIHEFGYPYKEIRKIKKLCEEKDIPLIENCAWTFKSKIDNELNTGELGDYVIYSPSKVVPLQYGGILKGLEITDEENWQEYQLLDHYKRQVIFQKLKTDLPRLDEMREQTFENWKYLSELFKRDGFPPLINLESGIYSPVMIIQCGDKFEELCERYISFGIECGKYYHTKSIFLPIHYNLTKDELDYIYGVFRGYLNLCSDYVRKS